MRIDTHHVPDGWRSVRLGKVVRFQQGGTPSKARPEFWDGDIPFVTGADLKGNHITRDNARSFLTKAGVLSGGTAICEEGALLLATRTRVGLVGVAGELMGREPGYYTSHTERRGGSGFPVQDINQQRHSASTAVERYDHTRRIQRRYRFPPHPPPSPAGAASHRGHAGLHRRCHRADPRGHHDHRTAQGLPAPRVADPRRSRLAHRMEERAGSGGDASGLGSGEAGGCGGNSDGTIATRGEMQPSRGRCSIA